MPDEVGNRFRLGAKPVPIGAAYAHIKGQFGKTAHTAVDTG